MHSCAKCNKEIEDINELVSGCAECGSKAFMHKRKAKKARTPAENVNILERGIYKIDLEGAANNPLVIKDENGVYHIRIPNGNGKPKANGVLNGKH